MVSGRAAAPCGPRSGGHRFHSVLPSAVHTVHVSHAELFLEARKPHVVFVQPEPTWVVNDYRVKRWYYEEAPEVGSKVVYLDDGSFTRVSRVSWNRIYLSSSVSMRRPYLGRRLAACLLSRHQTLTAHLRAATARRRADLIPLTRPLRIV